METWNIRDSYDHPPEPLLKKRTVVTPSSGWVLIALERLFPTLVDRQLERIYLQQQEKQQR